MNKDTQALLHLDLAALEKLANYAYSLVPGDPAEYEDWLKQPAEAEKCAGQRGFWLRCYTDLDCDYEHKYNAEVYALNIKQEVPITQARLRAKEKHNKLFKLVGRAKVLSKDFDSRYWRLKDLRLIGG